MIYWHIRMHRWKFTACAQQRHGTNCVLASIGTNQYFAIIWCQNRALEGFWNEIVLLILLQMTQCGLLDKWHVALFILIKNNYHTKDRLKEHSHRKKISIASIIELLLTSFLVYHSPICEAWKAPKKPIEVSGDVKHHLVAYQAALRAQIYFSGMPTHTRQHSQLPSMHTQFCLTSCT